MSSGTNEKDSHSMLSGYFLELLPPVTYESQTKSTHGINSTQWSLMDMHLSLECAMNTVLTMDNDAYVIYYAISPCTSALQSAHNSLWFYI